MWRGLGTLLLLVLASGCAAPAPEPVQPATGQIDGAVVDQLLRPFVNHPVYLMQLNARDDSSLRGGFTFRDVPVGTYTLLSSKDGYRSASAVVDVEADKITRVILQLLPIPTPPPYFESFQHRGEADVAVAGSDCASCSWDIPILGRPHEVIFEASWSDGVLTDDWLDIEVKDNRGMTLFHDEVQGTRTQPAKITIAGSDLHEGTNQLEVRVAFGQSFTTRTRFVMEEVATFYYGASHDSMFFV